MARLTALSGVGGAGWASRQLNGGKVATKCADIVLPTTTTTTTTTTPTSSLLPSRRFAGTPTLPFTPSRYALPVILLGATRCGHTTTVPVSTPYPLPPTPYPLPTPLPLTPAPSYSLAGLQLLEAIVKNCGGPVQAEIATKDFMDQFRRLVRGSTMQVKTKCLEIIQTVRSLFPRPRPSRPSRSSRPSPGHPPPSAIRHPASAIRLAPKHPGSNLRFVRMCACVCACACVCVLTSLASS